MKVELLQFHESFIQFPPGNLLKLKYKIYLKSLYYPTKIIVSHQSVNKRENLSSWSRDFCFENQKQVNAIFNNCSACFVSSLTPSPPTIPTHGGKKDWIGKSQEREVKFRISFLVKAELGSILCFCGLECLHLSFY